MKGSASKGTREKGLRLWFHTINIALYGILLYLRNNHICLLCLHSLFNNDWCKNFGMI